MSKDKNNVVERLRAKIQPENRIFVKKNLAISEQVEVLRKGKGWSQKELAKQLGKTESEVSRLLSGLHNITLKSVAKLEAILGSDIIVTPLQACERYKTTEYISMKVYVPVPQDTHNDTNEYDEHIAFDKPSTINTLRAS
jgi:transcriptional regulator with XRE-family HTH domain|tara:strand:+ start:1677 stop:2096 length:420 start_codon:yes stop_codon:yes gene_type:complete